MHGDKRARYVVVPRLDRGDDAPHSATATTTTRPSSSSSVANPVPPLGRGSHNSLYSLTFSDGTTCAASISNSPPAFFSATAKASEVATMRYIASSPLYSTIPIPRIFAADHTFSNPVHAPYILRSVVPGRNLSEDGCFYRLPAESKQRVIAALARIQAALSVPSEFTELGCIYHTPERGFHVGPAIPPPGADTSAFCGPFRNLPEVWAARLDREALAAATTLTTLPSPHLPGPGDGTPALLGEMLQLLSGLAPLFTPPTALSHPVLHHSDLALRNVLFDPDTLEVTGVIDWEFAHITPLVLTGRFPNDLGWEGNEFARSLGKMPGVAAGETWNHHYYDFTSLQGVSHASLPSPPASPVQGDYLSHPAQSTPSPPSPPLPPPPDAATNPADVKRRAEMLVGLFYWRKYYASVLGRERWECTRLCMDAVAYVKFNEVVMGGVERWVECKDWVREVYWRLEGVGAEVREGLKGGNGVVRVPEVFKKRLRPQEEAGRPMVVDLAD